MSVIIGRGKPAMPAESFERVSGSMASLVETVATELRAFQDNCAGDPMLQAKAQALVARVSLRIADALDDIHREFAAERPH